MFKNITSLICILALILLVNDSLAENEIKSDETLKVSELKISDPSVDELKETSNVLEEKPENNSTKNKNKPEDEILNVPPQVLEISKVLNSSESQPELNVSNTAKDSEKAPDMPIPSKITEIDPNLEQKSQSTLSNSSEQKEKEAMPLINQEIEKLPIVLSQELNVSNPEDQNILQNETNVNLPPSNGNESEIELIVNQNEHEKPPSHYILIQYMLNPDEIEDIIKPPVGPFIIKPPLLWRPQNFENKPFWSQLMMRPSLTRFPSLYRNGGEEGQTRTNLGEEEVNINKLLEGNEINLSRRELMRRRLNSLRVSKLMPDVHPKEPAPKTTLVEGAKNNEAIDTKNPIEQPTKVELIDSKKSNWFSWWPFSVFKKDNTQVSTPTLKSPVENISPETKQRTMLDDNNAKSKGRKFSSISGKSLLVPKFRSSIKVIDGQGIANQLGTPVQINYHVSENDQEFFKDKGKTLLSSVDDKFKNIHVKCPFSK